MITGLCCSLSSSSPLLRGRNYCYYVVRGWWVPGCTSPRGRRCTNLCSSVLIFAFVCLVFRLGSGTLPCTLNGCLSTSFCRTVIYLRSLTDPSRCCLYTDALAFPATRLIVAAALRNNKKTEKQIGSTYIRNRHNLDHNCISHFMVVMFITLLCTMMTFN